MSQIKCVNGIWLPKTEKVFDPSSEDWVYYQQDKIELALSYVSKFSLVLDIGAHCGMWSRYLSDVFERVIAFEPVKIHRDCFRLNAPEAEMIPYALGDKEQDVKMYWKDRKTECSYIAPQGTNRVNVFAKMRTLDSFGFDGIDFMKIDCEGYEPFIVSGAMETIKESRPVICIEQKPDLGGKYGAQNGIEMLEKIGYKVVDEIRQDYILIGN